jgi:regulator of replication initiation timing
MNDKIGKDIAIVIVCILLIIAAYSAITTSRELGDIRRANNELAERNRQLELSNTVYSNQLNAITDRIRNAQAAAQGAGDSVQRIKRIVSEIQAISLILRENSNPPSGNPSP